MKAVLVFFLWVLLFAALAVACWGIALWNEWPAWGALFLYFFIIGLWFFSRFLIRLYIGWRQRSRTAIPVEKPETEANAELALKGSWKEAIRLIKQSDLKRLGDPLYVLPWYMVIGGTGSGKTTALANTRLLSPLKTIDPTTHIETTQTIEWWYFDKAIVLDTSGRYINPAESEADRKEWRKVLDLLGYYRRKEGLNGLVIAVAADQLLSPDTDQLTNEGRLIRLRIEQLIRLFDKRFPVYLLVTKCDLIYGMETWSQLLPNNGTDQAMGYISDDTSDWTNREGEFVETAFNTISAQLKRLQLAFMQRANSTHNIDPTLLLFPHEFSQLKAALTLFLRHAQGESPYLESALLRGIFFCSGLQQGGASSTLLADTAPSDPVHEASPKGIFLHDIFHYILPADRHFLRPAAIVNRWRQLTQRLGLVAWLALTIATGFYLTFSFVYSLNVINKIRDIYPNNANLGGLLHYDTESLDRFREIGHWVEQHGNRKLSHFLAYHGQILRVEDMIEQNYVKKFQRYILPVFNNEMNKTLHTLAKQGRTYELATLIQALARNINIVQAQLDGATHEELLKMPPISGDMLLTLDPSLLPDFARYFNKMYIAYLSWQDDEMARLHQLEEMRTTLARIALDSNDLRWVISWADAQLDLQPVQLAIFWHGSRQLDGLVSVPPAFTRAGRDRIDAFFQEVRRSAPDVIYFDAKLAQFNTWYMAEKIAQWQTFTWNFSQGEQTLNGQNEWHVALMRLPTSESPYNLLMNQLANEFYDSDPNASSLPIWLQRTKQLLTLRLRATQKSVIGIPATINDVGGQVLKDLVQDKTLNAARTTLIKQIDAVKLYQAYAAALKNAVNNESVTPGKAMQVAAQFHSYATDPSAKSSLHDAYARLIDLTRMLGTGNAEEQIAWSLLAGPIQLAIRFADSQASCQLQQAWESSVLWPLQSSAGMPELIDKLYGSNGTVWSFLDGPAKPFIRRDASQYAAITTLGQTVPFTADFLPFVNAAVTWQVNQKIAQQQAANAEKQAEMDRLQQQQQWQTQQQQIDEQLANLNKNKASLLQANYPVTLTGLPTGVNLGAKTNVIGTLLTVQCAKSTFRLNNLNFSVTGSFAWSPSNCETTTLQIRFPTFSVTKNYAGSQGFVQFLRDFQNGEHRFTANDFPDYGRQLASLGVKDITVRYQFNGQNTVLDNSKQLESTDEALKKAQEEKQTIQTALANLAQQKSLSKLASSAPISSPMTVQIPGKIGLCWTNRTNTGPATPPIRKVIDELATAGVASAPLATTAPSSDPRSVPKTTTGG